MQNKIRPILFFVLLAFCLLKPTNFKADIVYPARLELNEFEPGNFEVLFILPVVKGQVLKATPILPTSCENSSEEIVMGDAFAKKVSWKIQCLENGLTGKNIGIAGLQGSQINILLIVNLLDGRSYTKKLNPASAYFQIPEPPSHWQMFTSGFVNGSQQIVSNPYLHFLIFSLILLSLVKIDFKFWFMASLAILLGYWLSFFELLMISEWVFPTCTLLICLFLSLKVSYSQEWINTYKNSLIFLALLLFGSTIKVELTDFVFTPDEEVIFTIYNSIGILTGLLLIILLWQLLKEILKTFKKHQISIKPLATCIGILSFGLLIFEGSLFWNTPSLFPSLPFLLILFLFALVIWLTHSGASKIMALFLFSGAFIGLGIGFSEFMLNFAWIIPLAAILVIAITGLFRKEFSSKFINLLLFLAAIASGYLLGSYANNNISFPLAFSTGYIFFGMFILLLSRNFIPLELLSGSGKKKNLVFALLIFGMCYAFWIQLDSQYINIINSRYLTGKLPIPIISIILIILALIVWPRNRKVHKQLKIQHKKPVLSMLCLGLGILCIPLSIYINNPWFQPGNMNKSQVANILETTLSNTYTAFNIKEEEKLFEELSENVDENLLDNIYLDSRRRLNMGLREGAEVTVQEVALNKLGDPEPTNTSGVLQYPATWTVTARVRHLKHIHYRKNKYTGIISLKSYAENWKISNITLETEDRTVIAASEL